MKAVCNITKIEWDTEVDVSDNEAVLAAYRLPRDAFSVTVEVDDKDPETVMTALLEYLSDTYGFLVYNVEYQVAGFTADVDESSHYS